MKGPASILVMGVCGCGKSSVGAALSEALGMQFLEADGLHPPENVARMAAGIPLTDEDRRGWLDSIAQRLQDAGMRGEGLVVACSALKRAYRDRLRMAAPDLRIVHLVGSESLLRSRMSLREGHFMPVTLLESQLATLEPPDGAENAIACDIGQPVDAIVDHALRHLLA